MRKRQIKRCLLMAAVFLLAPPGVLAESGTDKEMAFRQAWNEYLQHVDAGQLCMALPAAQAAHRTGVALYGENHQNSAALAQNWGNLLLECRDFEQAEEILTLALTRYEVLHGADSAEVIPLLLELATLARRLGGAKGTQMRRLLNRAVKIARHSYGDKSSEYGKLLVTVAAMGMQFSASKKDAARLRRGYRILRDALGPQHVDVAWAAFNMGKLEFSKRDHEEARDFFLEALAIYDKHNDESSRQLALSSRAFLVSAYEELGERELATEHCLAIGAATPVEPNQEFTPLFKTRPDYPLAARRRARGGEVIVEFTIDDEGFVRDPAVIDLKGHDRFGDAAMEAIQKWRYAPRFVDGEPVATVGVKHKMTWEIRP